MREQNTIGRSPFHRSSHVLLISDTLRSRFRLIFSGGIHCNDPCSMVWNGKTMVPACSMKDRWLKGMIKDCWKCVKDSWKDFQKRSILFSQIHWGSEEKKIVRKMDFKIWFGRSFHCSNYHCCCIVCQSNNAYSDFCLCFLLSDVNRSAYSPCWNNNPWIDLLQRFASRNLS